VAKAFGAMNDPASDLENITKDIEALKDEQASVEKKMIAAKAARFKNFLEEYELALL
jgi:hypothetical protein